MRNKEIIDGLQFTVDMFCFDPSTGEEIPKHRLNEESRLTVDACEDAIEIIKALEQESCGDCISRADAETLFRNARQALLNNGDKYSATEFNIRDSMLLNAEQMIHLLPSVNLRSCPFYEIDEDGHGLCKNHKEMSKTDDMTLYADQDTLMSAT